MLPRELFYARCSPNVTMEGARAARCLRALWTTYSNVHAGLPRQSLVYMGVLKELIGVVASVALLSRYTSFPVCSATMQGPCGSAGYPPLLVFFFERLPVAWHKSWR